MSTHPLIARLAIVVHGRDESMALPAVVTRVFVAPSEDGDPMAYVEGGGWLVNVYAFGDGISPARDYTSVRLMKTEDDARELGMPAAYLAPR